MGMDICISSELKWEQSVISNNRKAKKKSSFKKNTKGQKM